MRRPRARGMVPLVLLAASGCCVLAGCRPGSQPPQKTQLAGSNSQAEADVELALNWFPEVEHGGYFAALVHGYYKEAGLKVKILPGGPSASVLERVASEQVAFGIENADRVLLARAQQADGVAVMAPLVKSPRAIMVRAASPFHRIDELADVTLAVNTGSAWVQYLKKKVPLRNVRFVPYSGNVAQFLANENYAQQAYVFSEPYIAQEKGVDVRCLLVAETGYNPYTSLLITSGEMTRVRPELVRKFVAASVRGWQTYLERPEETNRYIHTVNPEIGLEALAFGAKAMRPLCAAGSPGENMPGRMTAERWKTLAAQLVEADVLTASGGDPSRAFTNEFLPEGKSHGTARK